MKVELPWVCLEEWEGMLTRRENGSFHPHSDSPIAVWPSASNLTPQSLQFLTSKAGVTLHLVTHLTFVAAQLCASTGLDTGDIAQLYRSRRYSPTLQVPRISYFLFRQFLSLLPGGVTVPLTNVNQPLHQASYTDYSSPMNTILIPILQLRTRRSGA